MDKNVIRQMLIDSTSCTDSLVGGTCSNAGTVIALKSSSGATVVSNNAPFTKLGAWTIRAECAGSSNNDGVLLRAAVLKPTGTLLSTNPSDFEVDPIRRRVLTWSDDETLLLPIGTVLCASSTLPPTPSISSVAISLGGSCGNVPSVKRSKGSGTVNCPSGLSVMGGGVRCGTVHDAVLGVQEGEVAVTMPSGNGWYAVCCYRYTTAHSPTPSNATVFVICK